MRDISPLLQSLGLQGSEIKTYMASLTEGPCSVIELSKKTSLSRQATYVAIESLTKRGLMADLISGKKRLFAAEQPNKLLAYAKRREAQLKEEVTDLEKMVPELELRVGGKRPVVRLLEGKEGIKALLEDLKAGDAKEIIELTDLEAMFKVLTPDDLKEFRDELSRKKTAGRALHTGISPLQKPGTGSRKALPKKYWGFNSNIGIYGNRLAMVTFTGKLYSLMIEDKSLLAAIRVLFELAWVGADHVDEKK